MVFGNATTPSRFAFEKMHNPVGLARKRTPQSPRAVRARGVFNSLTSKCALRHNSVHFFDVSPSKGGPELPCFVHLDFEMRFWRCNGVHSSDISIATSGPSMVLLVLFDLEM